MGIKALHYSGDVFSGVGAKHLSNVFRPNTISFTHQKYYFWPECLHERNLKGIENSTFIQSVSNPYDVDQVMFSWSVAETEQRISSIYARNSEIQGKKSRRCKHPRKSNAPLYYLRHLRSCAMSNQSQCSAPTHTQGYSVAISKHDGLQRTKRRYLGSPKDNVVSEGRQELVNAYQKHRAAFLVRYGGWFNINDNDINRRIRIHLERRMRRSAQLVLG